MPILDLSDFRFPTKEEEEQARRFQVVKNYLRNFYDYLSLHYGEGTDIYSKLLATQRALPNFQKIQRRKAEEVELKRRLWLAWGAEVQLRVGATEQVAILPYANAWAPVHAYYAVYMSMHALFVAMRLGSPPENHGSSLKYDREPCDLKGVFASPMECHVRGVLPSHDTLPFCLIS